MSDFFEVCGVLLLMFFGIYFLAKAIVIGIKEWDCNHEWRVHRHVDYKDIDTGGEFERELLICKKCGKIKKIKI